MSISVLPDIKITPTGSISKYFLSLNITSLVDVAIWIKNLPYGRNSDRGNYFLVLSESKGTCSTKHAIAAKLVEELQIPSIDLVVGIYKMSKLNTPCIDVVLTKYGLDYVPEAHCYLKIAGQRCDLTKRDSTPLADSDVFFEIKIAPEDIGEKKETVHKEFLQNWLKSTKNIDFSLDKIWQIREECIKALSEN